MKNSRFKLGDLKGFRQITPYLRPHKWGFIMGIFMLSLSGVLTLLVTRLWGQLGGVGVLGESANTAMTYGYDSVTQMQESKCSLCEIKLA